MIKFFTITFNMGKIKERNKTKKKKILFRPLWKLEDLYSDKKLKKG